MRLTLSLGGRRKQVSGIQTVESRRRVAALIEAMEERKLLSISAITAAATNVLGRGATLNGSVNPGGASVSVSFQYSKGLILSPIVQSLRGLDADFNGVLSNPRGVAVDKAGNIFVADTGNGLIQEILPDDTVVPLGPTFSAPTSLAIDSAGNIYVVEFGSNAVKKMLPDRTTVQTIGSGFSSPAGLAVDAAGNVFVADTGNNAVKKILTNGTVQTLGSGFKSPQGVAVDSAGNVFVADTGNKAVKKILTNQTVTQIGGTFSFSTPLSVAVDSFSGNVFVADFGIGNIFQVTPGNQVVRVNHPGNQPRGVAVDPLGNIYVADDFAFNRIIEVAMQSVSATPGTLTGSTATNVSKTLTVNDFIERDSDYTYRVVAKSATDFGTGSVQTFHTLSPALFNTFSSPVVTTTAATFISDIGLRMNSTILPNINIPSNLNPFLTRESVAMQVSSTGDFTPTVATNIASGLSHPRGVALDRQGAVFIADTGNNLVKEIMPDGTIITVGSGFNTPKDVAVSGTGNVFVVDSGNNAIKAVNFDGVIRTVATGFAGSGIALDASGNLYVAVAGDSSIRKILPNGTVQTIGSGFLFPEGVAVDSAGNVYVADTFNNAVKKILTNGTVQTLGTGFNSPYDVAVDPNGVVSVADNNSVKQILTNGTIKTLRTGYSSAQAIAVSPAGDVFVGDYGSASIQRLSYPETNVVYNANTGIFSLPQNSTPNTTYFYRGYARIGSGGGFAGTTLSATTLRQAVATTGAVTNITGTSAFVSGTVNPAGSTVKVQFQYSTDPSFPNTVSSVLGSGFFSSADIAVDQFGSIWVGDGVGNNVGFTTQPQPNAFRRLNPNGTVDTLATFRNEQIGIFYSVGLVSVNNLGDVFMTTDAQYRYLPDGSVILNNYAGLSDDVDRIGNGYSILNGDGVVRKFSPQTASPALTSYSGTTTQNVDALLTGLTPGKRYYYRTVLIGSGVASIGQTGSFISSPDATTGTATTINATGAVVTGTVNPKGTTTSNAFQYSTDANFTPTVAQTLLSGLNAPRGVAVDSVGNVYLADTFNNAVKRILTDGTVQTVGSGFVAPSAVAIDSAGNVYVAEGFRNTVKKVLPNGTIQTLGSGFSTPSGLATDEAGNVYVADFGNHAVKKILADGTIQTLNSSLGSPSGIAVDSTGKIYVVDFANNDLKQLSATGTVIKTLASNLKGPIGVTVDLAGNVYVGDRDNNLVKQILPDGTINTVGSGWNGPSGVAVDGVGNLYVADALNNRIVKMTPPTRTAIPPTLPPNSPGSIVGTLAGLLPGTKYYFRAIASGPLGMTTGTASSFTTAAVPVVTTGSAGSITPIGATIGGTVNASGATTAVRFQYSTDPNFLPTQSSFVGSGYNRPFGIAADPKGNIYVADENNNVVRKIAPDGTITNIGSGFSLVTDVAVDASGTLYVVDSGNNAIKRILPDGTISTVGSGFNGPFGIAIDAAGNLFVADTNNNAVKEILVNGTIKTIGSGFNAPRGVAVDAAGNVYVADYLNASVKKVQPDGTITTVGSGFNRPISVEVDPAGNVYVADFFNNDLKQVTPDGTIRTLGSGYANPEGVGIDVLGNVYVSDTINNRVVKLSPNSVAGSPASVTGTAATAISGALTGLTPKTTYYYRAIGTSATGAVVGSTLTFATLDSTTTLSVTAPGGVYNGSPYAATGSVLAAGSPVSGLTPVLTYFLASDTKFASPLAGAPTNAGSYVVRATFAGGGGYDAAAAVTASFSITKATPTATPNPVSIVFGTALANSQLTGTASFNGKPATGTFTFTSAAGTVPDQGVGQTFDVTFTPTDTTNLNAVATTVTVNVAKVQPSVTINPISIMYGTALTNGLLSGSASAVVEGQPVSVPGVFVFTSAAGTVPDAGNGQSVGVTFTPTDVGNFSAVSTTVTLNVAKATPSVTTTPISISFGTALADGQISGTATAVVNGQSVSVPGAFTFTSAGGSVLAAGDGQTQDVTFTPTDTTNFNSVATTVTVNVGKAVATINLTAGGGIYTGSAFAATGSATGLAGANLGTPTLAYYLASDTTFASPLPGAPVNAGSYVVVASYAGDSTYQPASANKSFSITQATALLSFTGVTTSYTGVSQPATGTATGVESPTPANLSSLLTLAYQNLATNVVTTIAPVQAGTYAVLASFAGNTNYAAVAPFNTGKTVQIGKAATGFAALTSPTITAGTTSTTLTGRVTSAGGIPTGTVNVLINGITASATLQAGGYFSVAFPTIKLPAGTYTVRYAYAGNANFAGSASTTTTIKVTTAIKVLFNNGLSYKIGSTITVSFQVTDATGKALTSTTRTAVATGIATVSAPNILKPLPTGSSPGGVFTASTDRSKFTLTLKTAGLAPGQYLLYFKVSDDPLLHAVSFILVK